MQSQVEKLEQDIGIYDNLLEDLLEIRKNSQSNPNYKTEPEKQQYDENKMIE